MFEQLPAAATEPTSALPFLERGLRVHMIGIGGAGMSGAAGMLLQLGAAVSGSDQTPFETMGRLVGRGARVSIGHDEWQVDDKTRLVVISAAIPESNPELAVARRRGLRVIKYAELLGLLMDHRRGVAVAGTHGKSTTTAMCAHLFREAGLEPSYIVGAQSAQLGSSSGVGKGPHFIVESCEFDRSFLHLRPMSAAILNIEPDHLDCFKDLGEIVEAFSRFAANVSSDGYLICNARDDRSREAAGRARCATETFGFDEPADWRAVNLRSDRGRYGFEVVHRGKAVLSTTLSVPGRYNVENALAAVALVHRAGGDPERYGRALSTFAGVGRRMTWRGERDGITIVDDYAHHPTEIQVTIEAARYRYEPKRVWVVFQPHQSARTRLLMDDFARSFGGADEIIVPDVYGAREAEHQAEGGGSAELVVRICRNGGRARYVPALHSAADHVVNHVTEGDLVLTMGAGDIWKVADELVERICGEPALRRAAGTDDLVSPGRTCSLPVPSA